MNTEQLFIQRLEGSLVAIASLRAQLGELAKIAERIIQRIHAGGTLYTAGNGGSAAQALHLAEELIGRYRSNRPPLPAVCLSADATALTCIANDFGFDQVFARQCEALITDRDVLIVFSTSGQSPNIVNALHAAKSRGAVTIGLLGKGGGACVALCDHSITIAAPCTDSAQIQEAHQVILHLICEALETQVKPR